MMMQRTEAEILLQNYTDGTATAEEKALLEAWYAQYGLSHYPNANESDKNEQLERIRFHLLSHSSKTERFKPLSIWPRVAAAASLLLGILIGAYFFSHKLKTLQTNAKYHQHDLVPGSNKAILTLANGRQIPIAGTKESLLAYQGNTRINLTSGNEVVYIPGKENSPNIQYNTLTTPRGGQYPITLSDGTKAWLDAASSITFPVSFKGNGREVKITGQVYFEVAHNAAKPFRVTAHGETVEVLGTHFNIKAYSDEPALQTTLFEGSVKIATANITAMLKPGQQASISHSKINVTDHADLDDVIAWHKGLFQFHDADIQTVMRQLSRWYDVDVSYEGNPTERRFSGKIYRNVSALKVSDILNYKEIHFRIEGKKIIVMP